MDLIYDINAKDLNSIESSFNNLYWPASYEQYEKVEVIILEIMEYFIKQANISEDVRAVYLSRAFDIQAFFVRIAATLTDLKNIAYSRQQIIYNSKNYPILDFFMSKNDDLSIIESIYCIRRAPINTKKYLREQAYKIKVWKNIILNNPDQRLDGFMLNPLLNDYLKQSNKIFIDMRIHQFSWRKQKYKMPQELSKLIKKLIELFLFKFNYLIVNNNEKYHKTFKVIKLVCEYHLHEAWSDYLYLNKLYLRKYLGNYFISGTPKFMGRLMSFFYQSNEKKVIRFSHGGDRAIFDDPGFELSEFPYCDLYYTSNKRETEIFNLKNKNFNSLNYSSRNLKFKYVKNSELEQTFLDSKNLKKNYRKQKHLLYVSAAYLGEYLRYNLRHRCSDTQYLDWQLWLFKKINDLGFKLTIKPHPKGIPYDLRKFKNISIINNNLRFNPNDYDVDCFLFDFAGSAFIKALSSKQSVLYFNFKTRVFNKLAREDIGERCSIVDCEFDKNNRFRFNPEDFKKTLNSCLNFQWSDSNYYKKYIL